MSGDGERTHSVDPWSPGRLQSEFLFDREVQKMQTVIQVVSGSEAKAKRPLDENENRAKRKRYSYPLLGSYEKEIPGIKRLPLSPAKSKQETNDLNASFSFRKPSVSSVSKGHSLIRHASATLPSTICSGLDIYDPIFSTEMFPSNTFNFERKRIIRRQKMVEANNYFSILPDEMVLKIFRFLGKGSLFSCLLVSQRFNELANDEILWKRIDASGKFLIPDSIKTIFRRNPTHVRLARALVPAPTSPAELFTASQLLYLDLSMAEITTGDLACIMSMCTSLKKCSLESLCITSEVIKGMMSFTSTIDTLNLTLCYDVDFQEFSKFIPQCKKLKSLNLGCMLQTWTREELMVIISTLPICLERLNIAGFVYRMKDEHVNVLVNRLLRLKELDLSDSQDITHKSVQYIVSNLKALESLSFSRCYNIPIGAYLLLPSAPRLRYVQLFAIFKEPTMAELQSSISDIRLNTEPFSTIARPTVGVRRRTIWGERVRD